MEKASTFFAGVNERAKQAKNQLARTLPGPKATTPKPGSLLSGGSHSNYGGTTDPSVGVTPAGANNKPK